MRIAKPAQELALVVDDADAWPEVRALQVDGHRRTKLPDVADRVTGIVHVKPARAMQVIPLRLILAVAVEHLDAVVLAVGDIDPAISIGADVVHDVEFAWASAGLAPRLQQLAVGRVFMDASIPEPVGDVDFPLGRQSGGRTARERLAPHILGRLAGHAD